MLLKVLKNSPRNCMTYRCVKGKFLKTPVSKLKYLGPRNSPLLASPNVPMAGCEKEVGSANSDRAHPADRRRHHPRKGCPLLRHVSPQVGLLDSFEIAERTVNGLPDCQDTIPVFSQLPSSGANYPVRTAQLGKIPDIRTPQNMYRSIPIGRPVFQSGGNSASTRGLSAKRWQYLPQQIEVNHLGTWTRCNSH